MSTKPALVFGNDHAGLALKRVLLKRAQELGYTVTDVGTHDEASTDYPDWAHQVAAKVLADGGLGILVCGTGIGVSIAANRHKGIRAALCGALGDVGGDGLDVLHAFRRLQDGVDQDRLGKRMPGLELGEKLWPASIVHVVKAIALGASSAFCVAAALLAVNLVQHQRLEGAPVVANDWLPTWAAFVIVPYAFAAMAVRLLAQGVTTATGTSEPVEERLPS